ncbi:MAG: hypothetical protein PHF37_03150 [Phycisphaerae bacterium]|nr:hypothetical protein [Phycisphaerae bacterium]
MDVIRLTKEWGVRVIFCTNSECLGVDAEGIGATTSEMACDAVGKAQDALFDVLGAFGEEDGFYHNWEGGKFAGSDYIHASFWKREIEKDEDGEESLGAWEYIGRLSEAVKDGVPAELVTKVNIAIDKAVAARGDAFDAYEKNVEE